MVKAEEKEETLPPPPPTLLLPSEGRRKALLLLLLQRPKAEGDARDPPADDLCTPPCVWEGVQELGIIRV